MLPDLWRRLRPLYGTEIDRLWIEYQLASVERKKVIEDLLTVLAIKKLGIGLGEDRIVLEPPPASVIAAGEYVLGSISYPGLDAYSWRVRRNELLRHVFLLGPTGTGKSTFLLGLLQQLLADERSFMVFDFKRNYRCLLHAVSNFFEAKPRQRVIVLTVGRDIAPFTFNAMRAPDGVPFPEWAEALADIISTAYLLMQGARNVLKEALLQAHEAHGEKATFARALELLTVELGEARSGSRRYGWLESSTRSLDELSKGGFGTALNAINGASIRSLLECPVVFELQGLGDDQKRFFCLLMLQAVLLVRKNDQAAREVLQHVLVFDESHNVFPKDAYGEVGIASRLAREVREYGEAILAATQQADVSESLIANAGFKIILRCDYPKDVQFASRLMQLDEKWFPKLALGSGIARLPTRYYQPFLFTFPEQRLKNHLVTDDEVRRRWQTSPLGAITPTPIKKTEVLSAITVSEKEDALLRDIASHPISYITHRYERLGWHPRVGNATKDEVIAKGLATFEVVATGTAQAKILTLADEGIGYLAAQGVTVPAGRRGGIVHEYWRWVIAERLQKRGFQIESEAAVGGGKTVDLRATKGDHVLNIEVETGRSDIPANIAKSASLDGTVVFFFVNPANAEEHFAVLQAMGAIVVTPETITLLDSI
jgi:Helicase HerA, central domain